MLKSRYTIFLSYFLNQGIKGLPNQGGVFYRPGVVYVPYFLVCIHVHDFHLFFNVFIAAVFMTYKEIYIMLLSSLSTFLLECEYMAHCVHHCWTAAWSATHSKWLRVIEDLKKKRECRYRWIFCVDCGLLGFFGVFFSVKLPFTVL